jgi:chromatin segregation and condensation protein Rec8/ScpA/Scc1 (kleisin family)
MRRLLEHQKFKAAAELLHERETLRSAQWTRPDGPIAEMVGRGARAGDRDRPVQPDHRVQERRSNDRRRARRSTCRGSRSRSRKRIEQLLSRLSETEACGFEELFDDIQTRAGLVVTFWRCWK